VSQFLLPKDRIDWVFLDLDNTLWDFDANAREALKVLFERHHLQLHTGYQVDQFISLYEDVNKAYWKRYEKGEVSKEILRTSRFTDTFALMGLAPGLWPENVWHEYLEICPLMPLLTPHALEALSKLSQKFKLGILTNGFEETQAIKLKESGIMAFIDFVQSSESVNDAKPNASFFELALNRVNVQKNNCLYIGDNLNTDVLGGIHSGILTYHYRYEQDASESCPCVTTQWNAEMSGFYGGCVENLLDWAVKLVDLD
jgi:putative hydrolase of the HAD superfamily